MASPLRELKKMRELTKMRDLEKMLVADGFRIS